MLHPKCMLVWVERGVCVCVCVFTVESGSLQITFHPFNMEMLPTGLLSVWPWEWHVEAANFCLPETHSESQGAPLKISRMKYSPRTHHNGTSTMHPGLGERGCVWGVSVSVCVCSLWNQAVCKSLVILLTWCCYKQDF